MLDAVARNYPLAQRWFVAKAEILGLDKLELHDQYAPIGDGRPVRFDEAAEIVTTSFQGFSPRIAAIAPGVRSTTAGSMRSRATASAAAPSAHRSRRTRSRTS